MTEELAPIVLFVYNRPKHTIECLEALSNNTLANQSKLYIFCDGVKETCSEEDAIKNSMVKELIREKQWCGEVMIKEYSTNNGLASSVINGVEEVINKYGKVIVLEDDLITSHFFLEYMNESLNKYKDIDSVMQISGFSFPYNLSKKNNGSYFLPISSTWGWATWKRVWDSVDFRCEDYLKLKKDKELRYNFNFVGSYDYSKMFFQQMESNRISSWGIRFYWNVFKKNGKILYPDNSLVYNNGWDGTGKHNDSYEIFPMPDWSLENRVVNYPDTVHYDFIKINNIAKYIKTRTSLFFKIYIKIKSIFKI